MESVSPVYSEKFIEYEKVIALDQEEYIPLIVLPINFIGREGAPEPHMMTVRFRFSEEERVKIAQGADLLIGELLYGRLYTPISLQLCMPDESPES